MTQTVKRDYEAANKDNNFIYNDLVPEFGTLEPPGKATLAKPTPFTSPSANFVDLFASLVPLAVSQAQQVSSILYVYMYNIYTCTCTFVYYVYHTCIVVCTCQRVYVV